MTINVEEYSKIKFMNIRRDFNIKHSGVKTESEFLSMLVDIFRYGRKCDHEKIMALSSELEKKEEEIKYLNNIIGELKRGEMLKYSKKIESPIDISLQMVNLTEKNFSNCFKTKTESKHKTQSRQINEYIRDYY